MPAGPYKLGPTTLSILKLLTHSRTVLACWGNAEIWKEGEADLEEDKLHSGRHVPQVRSVHRVQASRSCSLQRRDGTFCWPRGAKEVWEFKALSDSTQISPSQVSPLTWAEATCQDCAFNVLCNFHRVMIKFWAWFSTQSALQLQVMLPWSLLSFAGCLDTLLIWACSYLKACQGGNESHPLLLPLSLPLPTC